MTGRVLIVDDEKDFCELAADWLKREGFVPEWCSSAEEALSMHAVDEFDVVVADLHLEEMNGLELCKRIVGGTPDVPVVMMTAFGSLETAIGAIRAGAYDFVVKPCDRQQLGIAVRRAVDHRVLKREVRRLKEQIAVGTRPDSMIGDSPPMRLVYDLIERIGDSDTTVLICGESGTGKELVAQALHRRSHRHARPFVAVNCAALPASLLESELFGHVKGAFTDAKHDRTGLFEQAEGGSIFLDEIGEMPTEMQVKLLRALQDRKVRRVGGTEEKPFDARLITATNRDIEDAVESGRFREDLYYRINVVRIDLPPLRSRGNDVLLLAQTFIGRAAERSGKKVLGLSTDAAHRLREYNWPGNVRELQNCIEAAVALTKYEELVVEDLPEKIRRYVPQDFTVQTTNPTELPSLAEIERRYIFEVLNAVGGNKSAAAKILGFDRRTLYRKLESYLGNRAATPAS
jgi:two-component system response regulator HydG